MVYELVYIGAAWCGTCKTIKPQLEDLCKKFSVSMKILDYDKDLTEEEKETVTKVPTVRICVDGTPCVEFNNRQVVSTEIWFSEHVTLTATEDF